MLSGPEAVLICSLGLLVLGLYGLASKRNLIRLVISLEVLVNATCLAFAALSAMSNPGHSDPVVGVLIIIVLAVGGCIAAFGLALALAIYKRTGTVDAWALRKLRG
ncbi:MAG TPA: NADH-quinone oxidoreductase subunit K [Candidatus Bathyarchaeota archaeon]|nr:NADH-quinone oxidoreductase subunit K [Candidatus Bathyarchaeota archaeon]